MGKGHNQTKDQRSWQGGRDVLKPFSWSGKCPVDKSHQYNGLSLVAKVQEIKTVGRG